MRETVAAQVTSIAALYGLVEAVGSEIGSFLDCSALNDFWVRSETDYQQKVAGQVNQAV